MLKNGWRTGNATSLDLSGLKAQNTKSPNPAAEASGVDRVLKCLQNVMALYLHRKRLSDVTVQLARGSKPVSTAVEQFLPCCNSKYSILSVSGIIRI
jgi:hypothetical protein